MEILEKCAKKTLKYCILPILMKQNVYKTN